MLNKISNFVGKLTGIAFCVLMCAGALGLLKLSFIVFRWVIMGVWG